MFSGVGRGDIINALRPCVLRPRRSARGGTPPPDEAAGKSRASLPVPVRDLAGNDGGGITGGALDDPAAAARQIIDDLGFDDEIGAILADPDLARALDVPSGAPLVSMTRTMFDNKGAIASQLTLIPPGRGRLRTSIEVPD
jgi:hypothetical protein